MTHELNYKTSSESSDGHSTGLSSYLAAFHLLAEVSGSSDRSVTAIHPMQAIISSKKASSMAKCIATVLAVAAVLTSMQPSVAASNAPDADALRFPGRPSSRPRNPVFPGYPRARPSPPVPSVSSSPVVPSPVPSVPSSSAPVSPAPCVRPVVPQLPGFPGLGGSVGGVGGSGSGSGSPPSSPTDCVTPLAGLMTCGTFLTGSESETPTPQSECCNGLGAFLNSSSSGAAEGDDHTLRCLCPVILGDVNKMLPKPVDPVRMMYLPIACGVVLPPQVLYICFTGQQSPPLVGRIPDVWEKPNSALSP